LFAAMQAGGPLEDESALAALAGAKQPQDRLMACFAFALGPVRTRELPQFWTSALGRRAEQNAILTVAALLACARFPGAAAAVPEIRSDDPGIVAAMAFAGVAVPAAIMDRYWRFDEPEEHAGLVWRGFLLGSLLRSAPGQSGDADLLARARAVWKVTPERAGRGAAAEFLDEARGAAALVLGRAAAERPDGTRPPWHLLELLAAEPRSAALLANHPDPRFRWLQPEPQVLDEDPTCLAVEYVLGRPPQTVVDERDRWSTAPRIRQHVAVALAWRLLGAQQPAPVDVQVTGLPEWYFVRWATGAAGSLEGKLDDPVLAKAAALAQDGRLPRPVARDILEQTLWRWRSHPGRGLWAAERKLVRDLLLTGSQSGRKYKPRVRETDHYLPNGLGTQDAFFEVAVEALDFDLLDVSAPRLPIPQQCRLR
jgi:hypothetical protein